jgi:hypothetical protein
MADYVVRPEPERLDRRQDRQAGCEQGRLLDRRVDHVLHRAREAERAQVETTALATALVYRHRLGYRLGDLAAHPGLE